jgi:drug/metabolite transporter (DMT)-like permease
MAGSVQDFRLNNYINNTGMNVVKPSKAADWSLVLLVNFMWATQVPVIRLIGDRLGATTVAFIPLIISTVIFLPFLWKENKKRGVKMRWRWKEIRYFMLPGLIGIFLMQYGYTVGARMTLAANAGIITLTIPVIVALLASLLLKEKLNFVRVISFFLAIVGVIITSLPDLSEADFRQSRYFTGNLIFFLACCCCGYYNTYCKVLVEKKFTELEILVYSSIIGSLASLPLLIWVEPFHLKTFIQSGTIPQLGILELSLIVYGISMLLFFYVLKRMDVTQAILGNYLLPFFIAILGLILLDEKVTGVMIAGGLLILVSTLMVTVYEGKLMALVAKKGGQ